MSNIIHAKEIHEGAAWQDLTPGLQIYESATSKDFETGEWRVNTPVFDAVKCKQCLLCVHTARIVPFRFPVENAANLI